MSSLLVPVSVAAKVIKTKTPVPSLSGQPFNVDASLEPGIHVHWALPDALTRAKTLGGGTSKQSVIFPGVPDLWLVTRFNPPPAAGAASPARTWRAWVVDARAKTSADLDKWLPPAAADPNSVHTLPGVLPSAASVGFPGWGLWNSTETDFDAALTSAIYYPSCRTRFGFYDDLSGLPASGNVSYTVVGWYSGASSDPLYNAADREKQIYDWLLSYDHHRRRSEIIPAIASTPLAASAWKPTLTFTQQTAAISPQARTRLDLVTAQTAERTSRMKVVQAALGKDVSANPGLVFYNPNPVEIVCHGSVMDVPLGAVPASATTLDTSQISVHPSIKRALAAATAANVDSSTLDYAEMLLQDLDHQKGTMAGIMDLPGAAQALTFQSVPGAATFFAQIRIAPQELLRAVDHFDLASASEGLASSAHWPELALERAFQIPTAAASSTTSSAASSLIHPGPQGPPKLAQADIDAWLKKVRDAFHAAQSQAQAAGTPIDPNLIKVSDTRTNAQPLRLAPSIDGSGTSSGGWWVGIDDDDALTQILQSTTGTTATIQVPDAKDLFNQPGPRWYRPWSPQIVLNDAGRSYRFGEDGRFDPVNGRLLCRRSGYTTVAIYSNTGTAVSGSQLLANPAGISNVSGLPSDTLALLNEAVLLDTGSAPSMAAVSAIGSARAAAESYFTAAIQGLYLQRLPDLSAQTLEALGKIRVSGDRFSPVAISPWKDLWEPLFLDSTYTYAYTSIETDWKLEEDQVEMTAATPLAANPPAAQVETFNDRSRVTATIAKVLESALVTRRSLDPQGNLVLRHAAPNELTQEVFQKKETISAPLVHTLLTNKAGSKYGSFDDALFARGYRQRAGVLRLNKLNLVDVFGLAKQWSAPPSGPAPATPLSPRLPFWSRLRFRLQSSADVNTEADSKHSAICGILLPDFFDHSLQIFDAEGNALGQLTCDRARFGGGVSAPAVTLKVHFMAYPWVLAARGVTATDPIAIVNQVIDNVTLRAFVAGVLQQQSVAIPAGAMQTDWFETALTAMLRTIDSVRATLDPSSNTADHKAGLLGEPILVMVGRVEFQTNAATDSAAVAKGSPLTAPPAIPSIQVRIGDITRPDDGVLGIFNPGTSPANSHFAPVSKDAADKALINTFRQGFVFNTPVGMPVQHPFVKNQPNAITVQADVHQDVIMLSDIRGDLYATCGVLPRKSIVVPKDFLDASLQNMEPVFAVGPVLTAAGATGQETHALMPPPSVLGYDAGFVSSSAAGNPPPEIRLPPAPPIADLPPTRVKLTEGWVLMHKHKSA